MINKEITMSKEYLMQLRSIKDQQVARLAQRINGIPYSPETPNLEEDQAFETYTYVNGRVGEGRSEESQVGSRQLQQAKSAILYEYNQFLYEQAMAQLKLQQFILNATKSIEYQKQLEIKRKIEQIDYSISHSIQQKLKPATTKFQYNIGQDNNQEVKNQTSYKLTKPSLHICSLEINTGHQSVANCTINTTKILSSQPELSDLPFKSDKHQLNSTKNRRKVEIREPKEPQIGTIDLISNKKKQLYLRYDQVARWNKSMTGQMDATQKHQVMKSIKKFWKTAKSVAICLAEGKLN